MHPQRLHRITVLSILAATSLLRPWRDASAATVTLVPAAISNASGSMTGSLGMLAVKDQGGSQTDASHYVTFNTPAVVYEGYRSFLLPTGIVAQAVTGAKVDVNVFKGPTKSSQVWSWYLLDWNLNAWIKTGDSTFAKLNAWTPRTFGSLKRASRFVGAGGELRLLLRSSDASLDLRVDYEALTVTYNATSAPPPPPSPGPVAGTLPPPPAGCLYHGVYPGGISGDEDDLTLQDLRSYETAAGKVALWTYFSHNWFNGRAFPLATASWIRDAGSVPYIRLMLRSDSDGGHADPTFTLNNIIKGKFDADLHAWGAAARAYGSNLVAEYGVEVNGDWFPWNGYWNGAGNTTGYGDPGEYDGPERFRDAYRRIIQICRDENATNITWVFHVDSEDSPEAAWNELENYYPGDAYIDWIAVSVYTAQAPTDDYWDTFRNYMDTVYPRLTSLSTNKPIIVAEFGATAGNPLGDPAVWARAALTDLAAFRWPRVIGFSWWNEWWENDNNPAHDSNMRLQDNPALTQAFRERVGSNAVVLGRMP